MAENDFRPLATAPGANVTRQDEWVLDPITLEGFLTGTLPSAKLNKALRQGTFVAAATAQVILDTLGIDVRDNGNLGLFAAQLAAAIAALGGGGGGGFPDAPPDGQAYARRSPTWVLAVPAAGGSMTGPLLLAANPTAPLGAVTKDYADNLELDGGVY